jgi:hypothetical protein
MSFLFFGAQLEAQVIDFEWANAGTEALLPQGYAGFNWLTTPGESCGCPERTEWGWANGQWAVPRYQGNAILNKPVSGLNSIWASGGWALSFSKTDRSAFNFFSAWLAAGFGEGGTQTVTGYRAGTQVYSATVRHTGTMNKFYFDFYDVDEVGFSATPGYNTILDDLEVGSSTVPEPASVGLTGVGLVGILMIARRRRRQALGE